MSVPVLVAALIPVLEVLRRLEVRHAVTGSLASSAHGVPRASIDVDVVAALGTEHAPDFIAALRDQYYVPEARVMAAVAQSGAFNLIHLETMIKVDVFVSRDRPFDNRVLERAGQALLAGAADRVPVTSPEDTLLAKLEWFRRGGEVSERQWGDVVGLLRVVAHLDRAYLEHGARELGVSDLLHRALHEGSEGSG
jgi:hypothetical protein